MPLPEDPIDPAGIPEFGKRLRNGDVSARAAAKAYLDRIEALDPVLSAYVHVDGEAALRSAEAIDRLLAAGTDLGPLMGVPVAVKDIIAVSGMPTGCGSLIQVDDLIGEEGSFVRRLRRLGCVILGKLNTVEFATGNTGFNLHCGTPRNPWDAK